MYDERSAQVPPGLGALTHHRDHLPSEPLQMLSLQCDVALCVPVAAFLVDVGRLQREGAMKPRRCESPKRQSVNITTPTDRHKPIAWFDAPVCSSYWTLRKRYGVSWDGS